MYNDTTVCHMATLPDSWYQGPSENNDHDVQAGCS